MLLPPPPPQPKVNTMATKTDTIRKGLLASGWVRTDTRSARECYTKQVATVQRNPATGLATPGALKPMWLWLGKAASVRWANSNSFTAAYPVHLRMVTRLFEAGLK